MQEPQEPIPQPNLVPVRPRTSRSAQRSGVSGATSTGRGLPFTDSVIMAGSWAGARAPGREHSGLRRRAASLRGRVLPSPDHAPRPPRPARPRPAPRAPRASAQQSRVYLPPSAVLTNYDRVLIGQEEALESGAFVARVADSTAGWYNPAGLALVRRSVDRGQRHRLRARHHRPRRHPDRLRARSRSPSSPATSARCSAATSSPPTAGGSASRPPSPPPGRRR